MKNYCKNIYFQVYLEDDMGPIQIGNVFFLPTDINFFVRVICAITAFVIFFKADTIKRYNHIYRILQVFTLCMGCWNLFYVGYMLARSPESVAFFNSLIYTSNSFAAAFFFQFAFTYTFPLSTKKKRWLKLVLVIPAMTSFFSLTYMFHEFMIYYDFVLVDEITRIPEHFGPWWNVHLTYSYLIILAGLICLLIKLKRKSTPNKKTVFAILIGSSFLIFWNFLFAVPFDLQSTDMSVTLSGLSHLFCIVTIFSAVRFDNIEQMILLTEKNREILTPYPVFIVDLHGIVVYFNSAGEDLVRQKSLSPYGEFTFENFLAKYNKIEISKNIPLAGAYTNFMLEDPVTKMIWYVQGHPLYNRFSTKMGLSYTFNNISYINQLMATMEKYAFQDMLTGAYNRHFFEIKKDSIYESAQESMSIILCDIDNLKKVNDNYGHTEGDDYIKYCSKALFNSVRKKDFIFRIGGDEFLIMLPDTDMNIAEVIISRIHENLEATKYDEYFVTGMSIGYVTSPVSDNRDFIALMDQADKAMYRDKQKRKVGR